MQRRQLLRFGALASLSAVLGRTSSVGAAPTDYRAGVCICLSGGNDANNMVVPLDPAGYLQYQRARPTLALARSGAGSLLPIAPRSGGTFGLHPAMPELQNLFAQGRMAVLANVGTLIRPTTKDQWLQNGYPLPANLLSHEDQLDQWSTLDPNVLALGAGSVAPKSGWGARIMEALASLNATATFPSLVATGGSSLFYESDGTSVSVIDPAGPLEVPLTGNDRIDAARRIGIDQLAALAPAMDLEKKPGEALRGFLAQSSQIKSAFARPLRTVFPASYIGQQMFRVAQIVAARDTLGLRRQMFYVELGSFDTHANQLRTQDEMLRDVSQAMGAFYAATVEMGVSEQVVTFTHSEFSRTLKAAAGSDAGTDHAWGGHAMIMGGTVNGGDLYGTFPRLDISGPDDASDEGRWIPTTSAYQYAATIARWLGVADADLVRMLPNLENFPARTLPLL